MPENIEEIGALVTKYRNRIESNLTISILGLLANRDSSGDEEVPQQISHLLDKVESEAWEMAEAGLNNFLSPSLRKIIDAGLRGPPENRPNVRAIFAPAWPG